MEETKKCPYCGEEIRAAAKKCRHCGQWLDTDSAPAPEKSEEPNSEPEPASLPSDDDGATQAGPRNDTHTAPAPQPEPDRRQEPIEPQQQPQTEPEPQPQPDSQPQPQPDSQPQQEPEPQPVPPRQEQQPRQQRPQPQRPQRKQVKSSSKPILSGIIAALAAIAIGALCWLLWPDTYNVGYEVEYLPYQESAGGTWGLIAPDGEVLFSEEFKSQPTVAVNGRFMVRNEEGLWDIYTAEKKPRKIAGDFVAAGLFYDKVVPVIPKDKGVRLIDRDGNVVCTLDKIGSKKVTDCQNFVHGLAVVKVGDYYGAINTKGELVIEPRYISLEPSSGGKFLAVSKKYEGKYDPTTIVSVVINSKGEEMASLKGSKFGHFNDVETSTFTIDKIFLDLLAPTVVRDGKPASGLINTDGEWVVDPSTKLKSFSQMRAKNIIFYNGNGYGLIGINGEQRIRAKFNSLFFVDNDLLAARKQGETDLTLVNLEGKDIGTETYKQILPFYDGKHAFVQIGQNDWTLIGRSGKEVRLKTDVVNIGMDFGSPMMSELKSAVGTDVRSILESLKLSDDTASDDISKDTPKKDTPKKDSPKEKSKASDDIDDDYGELESPPADDL